MLPFTHQPPSLGVYPETDFFSFRVSSLPYSFEARTRIKLPAGEALHSFSMAKILSPHTHLFFPFLNSSVHYSAAVLKHSHSHTSGTQGVESIRGRGGGGEFQSNEALGWASKMGLGSGRMATVDSGKPMKICSLPFTETKVKSHCIFPRNFVRNWLEREHSGKPQRCSLTR